MRELGTFASAQAEFNFLLITIHNPSFATTPLSPGKIKKAPPKLINFTYTKVSLNI
jgi:hypothetical protein